LSEAAADELTRDAGAPRLRPRDAATLIVLRRDADALRVLMGRRSGAHAFMPDKLVFPGGAIDATDFAAPSADSLHPDVEAKLLRAVPRRWTAARARAAALAAIRETFEETGLLVGREAGQVPQTRSPAWRAFLAHGCLPALSSLRFVARAITPPGRIRRFDARFFAVFAEDDGMAAVAVPPDELLEVRWLTFEEAFSSSLPRITATILSDLAGRLAVDPALEPDGPVPFHYARAGRMRRELL